METVRIRDKHPGSATLTITTYLKLAFVIIFFESVVGVVIYRWSSPVDTRGASCTHIIVVIIISVPEPNPVDLSLNGLLGSDP